MKNNPYLLMALIAAGTLMLAEACTGPVAGKENTPVSKEEQVKKGAYLVGIAGCGDCHSPKVMTAMGPAPDSTRILSGYRSEAPLPPLHKDALKSGWALFGMEGTSMVSPVGISFAANLTPDATGIGDWTLPQFTKALTEGKWKGLDNSRPLLPPMPWQNYRNMAPDDIAAIFEYLKSLPPVKNLVPAPVIFEQSAP